MAKLPGKIATLLLSVLKYQDNGDNWDIAVKL